MRARADRARMVRAAVGEAALVVRGMAAVGDLEEGSVRRLLAYLEATERRLVRRRRGRPSREGRAR